MNKVIVMLTGAAILGVSSLALAAKTEGFYVGGNVGYGKVNEEGIVTAGTNAKIKGVAWGLNGGYLFNQNFATEAAFIQFPNEKMEPDAKAKNNYTGVLAGVGILPLENGFNVFGKLGIAAVHHKLYGINGATWGVSKTRAAAYLGAGVGYELTDNVAVNLAVDGTVKNGHYAPSMWRTVAGVSYLF